MMPPSRVNIGDLTLLKRLKYNPVVLSIIVIFWTTFVLLLVWARQRDEKVNQEVCIHVPITETLLSD